MPIFLSIPEHQCWLKSAHWNIKNLSEGGTDKIQTFYNEWLHSALSDYEKMHQMQWMYSCIRWQMLMLLRMCCCLSHSSKLPGRVSLNISARLVKVLFVHQGILFQKASATPLQPLIRGRTLYEWSSVKVSPLINFTLQ